MRLLYVYKEPDENSVIKTTTKIGKPNEDK